MRGRGVDVRVNALFYSERKMKMKTKTIKVFITTMIVVISAMVFSVAASATEITLPDIISDHMLIQQGEEIHLWGTAGAGEVVSVTISANETVYNTCLLYTSPSPRD